MLQGIQNENPREQLILFCYKLSYTFLIFTVTLSLFLLIFSAATSPAKGVDYSLDKQPRIGNSTILQT